MAFNAKFLLMDKLKNLLMFQNINSNESFN